jgi:hypothetical protein
MTDEKKPRLTMDSNLRTLDRILKLAETLGEDDLAYLMARLEPIRLKKLDEE